MLVAAIGLLLATAMAVPAEALRPRLHLRLEVEPGVALTAGDLEAIATGVRRIWAPLLDVAVSDAGDVRAPIVVDTVRVVLTNRTLRDLAHTGLAWIRFVDGKPQPDITLSVAAVRDLRAQGKWHGRPFSTLPPQASELFLQRALARALAHEVGHYLLRSAAHASRGLMRPVFSVDDLMDAQPALDRLDRKWTEQLRLNDLMVVSR